MYLRVFDPDGDVIAELRDVGEASVTSSGALVAMFRDGRKYVCNPLCWHDLTEYPDDWPVTEAMSDVLAVAVARVRTEQAGSPHPEDEPAPQPDPPVVPGPDDEQPSDLARVHDAMSIVCQCDALRCPVVLNPAPEAEKKARGLWAWRGRNPEADTLTEPEPYMRCSWEAGHDVTKHPHEWKQGGWTYGPNEHHPECPRNPENYNNPAKPVLFPREGQQTARLAEPAGITTGDEHAVREQSSAVAVMDQPDLRLFPPFVLPDQPDTSSVRHAAAAEPITELHEPEVMTGVFPRHAEGGAGGGLPLAPGNNPTAPRSQTHNESACVSWGVCGYWAPEQAPYARALNEPRKWCTGIPNHPGKHTLTYGGGERLEW